MDEKLIREVFDPIIHDIKGLYSIGTNLKGKWRKSKMDYHPTYEPAVMYRDRCKTHAEAGCEFPEELFKNRYPNQTEDEYKYIKNNFKQTTLPVYAEYLQCIGRSFNEGNYDLRYQEDDKEFKEYSLQSYVETKIDLFHSLENYMKSLVIHLKSVDANGVLAVKPKDIYYVEKEGTQEKILDTGRLYEPQPYYYRCDQILAKVPAEYYLILTDEKSWVEVGEKKIQVGLIFEYYDKNEIVRIEQTGKFSDWTFSFNLYLDHKWDRVPVKEMEGIPQVIENKIVWLSPFLYACANLDLALMNAQFLQASISKSNFPHTVMIGDDCSYEESDASGNVYRCIGGDIQLPITSDSTHQQTRKCPRCHGSGIGARITQLGVLFLRKDDWQGQGDNPRNALYFVEPSTDGLKFTQEFVEMNTQKARKILHLQDSNTEIKGNETATFAAIDMKAMYAFIKPISDQNFDIYEFLIDATGWQRYGNRYKKPTLTRPDTFDYNTEADYINRIVEVQKAGIPSVTYTMIYSYLSSLKYNQKESASMLTLLASTDRLLALSQNEISIKLSKGQAESWESVLHDSGIVFIMELVQADEKFFEKELEEQQTMLIEKAKLRANEIDQVQQEKLEREVDRLTGEQEAA